MPCAFPYRAAGQHGGFRGMYLAFPGGPSSILIMDSHGLKSPEYLFQELPVLLSQ